MKKVSTSALAKTNEIEPKELFSKLINNGLILRDNDTWKLTDHGVTLGGEMYKNPTLGEYIVWPENLDISFKKKYVTATQIGEILNIPSRKVNMYLSELGWSLKNEIGWHVTPEGIKNGGFKKTTSNGIPYVVWEENITSNVHLLRAIKIGEGELSEKFQKTGLDIVDDFRLKFPAELRTSDGHLVSSRAEMLIDNFLYYNKIVHAYEKKVNIDEPMFCDFFIPGYNIYIEFWGLDEEEKYKERKKRKLELYAKYNFKLIELSEKDLNNLDETLAMKLRIFNVHVE